MPLNAHQTLFAGIPEAAGFLVIEDEGIIVGPPGRRQGKVSSIDLPAVHSGQIHQRSVGRGDGNLSNMRIGDLVARQCANNIGMGIGPVTHADDPGLRINRQNIVIEV